MKYKRIFTIVMDSVGCGEAPDSEHYGDRGADTIGHIAKTVGGLTMPAMEKLGYGNLHSILGVEPQAAIRRDITQKCWKLRSVRTL